MAKKKTKPKRPQIIMVTDGCGCVFCDLDLEPTVVGGHPVHVTKRGNAPCTKSP